MESHTGVLPLQHPLDGGIELGIIVDQGPCPGLQQVGRIAMSKTMSRIRVVLVRPAHTTDRGAWYAPRRGQRFYIAAKQ